MGWEVERPSAIRQSTPILGSDTESAKTYDGNGQGWFWTGCDASRKPQAAKPPTHAGLSAPRGGGVDEMEVRCGDYIIHGCHGSFDLEVSPASRPTHFGPSASGVLDRPGRDQVPGVTLAGWTERQGKCGEAQQDHPGVKTLLDSRLEFNQALGALQYQSSRNLESPNPPGNRRPKGRPFGHLQAAGGVKRVKPIVHVVRRRLPVGVALSLAPFGQVPFVFNKIGPRSTPRRLQDTPFRVRISSFSASRLQGTPRDNQSQPQQRQRGDARELAPAPRRIRPSLGDFFISGGWTPTRSPPDAPNAAPMPFSGRSMDLINPSIPPSPFPILQRLQFVCRLRPPAAPLPLPRPGSFQGSMRDAPPPSPPPVHWRPLDNGFIGCLSSTPSDVRIVENPQPTPPPPTLALPSARRLFFPRNPSLPGLEGSPASIPLTANLRGTQRDKEREGEKTTQLAAHEDAGLALARRQQRRSPVIHGFLNISGHLWSYAIANEVLLSRVVDNFAGERGEQGGLCVVVILQRRRCVSHDVPTPISVAQDVPSAHQIDLRGV
ncbi:hypothetical protein G7046_g8517 [Stylonectria norvegica]|nr:hypothetical protein G7046_g8517 [Stylonectria norvegica]